MYMHYARLTCVLSGAVCCVDGVGSELFRLSRAQLKPYLRQLGLAERRLAHFEKGVQIAVRKGECPIRFLENNPFEDDEDEENDKDKDEDADEEEEDEEANGRARV